MRTNLRALLWVAAFTGMLQGAATADDSGRAIMKQALDALPTASFAARAKVSTDGVPARELELRHKYIDKARSSYLEVAAPADLAGIRFLFLHRVDRPPLQYIKVAASRRSILVTDDSRSQPFLDSAYSVADVIEPQLDAFTYRVVGETEIEGRKCRFVEAVPKDPESQLYGRTVFAIDVADNLILKREYYDRRGELVKVLTIEKIERIDGIWTLRRQRMKDLKSARSTTIELLDIRYNETLDDAIFTPEYLLR